jgi:hypothetical protein
MRALPEIPLQDIVLGLASAALLLLAAYFLGRPREQSHDPRDQELQRLFPSFFWEIAPDQTRRRLSLITSVFCHLMAFSLAPWLQVMFPGPLPFRYPRQAITLEYHIPLPPLLAPSEVASLDESTPPPDAKEYPDGDSENPKLAQSAAQPGSAPKLLMPPGEEGATANPRGGEQDRQAAGQKTEASEETAAQRASVRPAGERGSILAPKEIVKLVLPPAVETDPALRDIVLQPDFTIPLPDDYKLDIPPVLLWTSQSPRLQDKVLLEPTAGDATAPSHMRLPELQPQLSRPNDLPTLADIQAMSTNLAIAEPKLPVTTGDVLPLRGRLPTPDALTEVPSIRGGRGTNSLMVFSQDPNLRTPEYELIAGLRLGAVEPSPGELPQGVAGGTQSLENVGDNVVISNTPTEGTAVSTGAGSATAAGTTTAGAGATIEAGAEGAGDGSRQIQIMRGSDNVQIVNLSPGPAGGGYRLPGDDPEAGAGQAQSGAGAGASEAAGQPDGSEPGKGRLKPLPRARYGIILVSNAKGALPEAEGVLSGNPIYTVYFGVPESPRKWVLQYCMPKNSTPTLEFNEGAVRVLPRKKLDPPYALRKGPVRLNTEEPSAQQVPPRVVVYATFDAEGRFENSRIIRGADAQINQAILAALRSWEFLPAFAEGEPVLVEALLGIPLR